MQLPDGARSMLQVQGAGPAVPSEAEKRMGRRPVAQKLPYGTTSVMQLVEDSQSHSVNPISGGKFISDNVTLTSLTGHPHRRCRRSDVRIPYPNTAAPVDATARTGLHYGPPSFHALRLPLQGSWQVHQLIDTAEGFFQVHRTFMLGRSFVDGFQSVVRRLFARSPQVLTDAYSVAFRLMSARHATFPSLDGDDLAIGARCLRSLMAESSSIKHPEDAAVIILLGQALLVYNTLIPSPTTQVITRGTLLSVKHWYSALVKRPYLDAVTLTPVLVDTVECLVRRDMPVVRLPTPDRCIIDRFLGVCSSLLPLLYDLCERSYQAKTNGFQEHSSPSNPDRHDTYSDIERKIRDWAPELPPCFFTTFSALEVSVMLAQARSYRLATLLVIHRLRFPLGVNDRVGQYYAGDILRELSILKTWPSDEATGLGLDFPLLVATLEMPGPGMDIYKAFEPLRFRQQHSEMILDFIRFVTAARDTGYTGLWFDLLQDQLQGVTIT
ncbi:hypothetical protein AOCH_003001 [Aspergillus ochraceoroseus]|uniref:Zn(II)2Cys6 transcription factor n=1 Tax=Aspergillus ochraceoroseus TaxID=138278 RepID=A0A0F8UPP3_9EURO|nr:hypothetical protein AOCH_003001 [Aspergillus ochraceoroseus]